MKKILLIFTIIAFGLNSNAQSSLKIGLNTGIHVNKAKDYSSYAFEVEANKLSQIFIFFDLGIGVSYQHFSGKEIKKIKSKDIQILPVFGSARLNLGIFVLGLDAGYAFGLSSNIKGAIYGKTKIGIKLGDNFMIQAIASGTENRIMSGLGFMFSL